MSGFNNRNGFAELFNEGQNNFTNSTIGDLIVTDSLTVTGAQIIGFPVDDVTVEFASNILQVKDGGISNIKISDMDASKLTGIVTVDVDNNNTTSDNMNTDVINEKTLNAGVTIEGVLIKDGEIEMDEIRLLDGSLLDPSFAYISQPDLGIFRGGANIISFASSGVNPLSISNIDIKPNVQTQLPNGTQLLPPLSGQIDPSTGVKIATNNLSLIANGFIGVTIEDTAVTFGAQPRSNGTSFGATLSKPHYASAVHNNSGLYFYNSGALGVSLVVLGVEKLQLTSTYTESFNPFYTDLLDTSTSTPLLIGPSNTNVIKLGSGTINTEITGVTTAIQGILTNSLDTIIVTPLSIGTTNASSITISKAGTDTTIFNAIFSSTCTTNGPAKFFIGNTSTFMWAPNNNEFRISRSGVTFVSYNRTGSITTFQRPTYFTSIVGSNQYDGRTAVPLVIGGTIPTIITLGSATIDTNVKGNLLMTGYIDSETVSNLLIGPLNATDIRMGRVGQSVYMEASLRCDGNLYLENGGTVAFPIMAFTSNVQSGISYNNGSNAMYFSINGVQQLRLNLTDVSLGKTGDTITSNGVHNALQGVNVTNTLDVTAGTPDIKYDNPTFYSYITATTTHQTTITVINTIVDVNLTTVTNVYNSDFTISSTGLITYTGNRDRYIKLIFMFSILNPILANAVYEFSIWRVDVGPSLLLGSQMKQYVSNNVNFIQGVTVQSFSKMVNGQQYRLKVKNTLNIDNVSVSYFSMLGESINNL